MTDDVLIVPAPGTLADTARVLLDLAGDTPEIVRTVRGGTEFLVPSVLAELYEQSVSGSAGAQTKRRSRPRSKE